MFLSRSWTFSYWSKNMCFCILFIPRVFVLFEWEHYYYYYYYCIRYTSTDKVKIQLRINIVTYEWFAWLIITSSRLDDRNYWHFFTITIMTAHNQRQSTTWSIPSWTTRVFSSTVTNDESLLTHWTPSEFLLGLRMNCDSFIKLREDQRQTTTPNSSYFGLLYQLQRKLVSRCLANGLPLLLLFRLPDGVYRTVAWQIVIVVTI
jgi:hypothetical protein